MYLKIVYEILTDASYVHYEIATSENIDKLNPSMLTIFKNPHSNNRQKKSP